MADDRARDDNDGPSLGETGLDTNASRRTGDAVREFLFPEARVTCFRDSRRHDTVMIRKRVLVDFGTTGGSTTDDGPPTRVAPRIQKESVSL